MRALGLWLGVLAGIGVGAGRGAGAAWAGAQWGYDNTTYSTDGDVAYGIRLMERSTNQSLEVLWNCGGRIEGLVLLSHERPGNLRSVLLTHEGNATAMRGEGHYYGAVLMPWANRIANGTYEWRGTTLYLPRNEENEYREDALHGFLLGRNMTIDGVTTDPNGVTLSLSDSWDATTYPGWPFSADVGVQYRLETDPTGPTGKEARMRITYTVTNTDEQNPLPFYSGAHPYVAVSDVSQVSLRLDPRVQWAHVVMPAGAPKEGSLIPTGVTELFSFFDGTTPIGGTAGQPVYWDDEFKPLSPTPLSLTPASLGMEFSLDDPVTPDRVTLWTDHNNHAFHVFTGSTIGWGATGVAMEPMSGLADAYNNHDGLHVLSAGETRSFQWGFRLETRSATPPSPSSP